MGHRAVANGAPLIMPRPALWKDDPDCGHEVACEFQTHYCTYIRVPRLLTLQRPRADHPAETLALLALQACELWFAVLISDLRAALADLAAGETQTHEPAKLLRRCSSLIKLLDHQTDVAGSILARDAGFRIALRTSAGSALSPQFAELALLTRRLKKRLKDEGEGMNPPASLSLQPFVEAGNEYLSRFSAWRPRYLRLLKETIAPAGPRSRAPAYADFVALPELLSLQNGVKADWSPKGEPPTAIAPAECVSPDELMFIVVHQAFELWFKAILGELDSVIGLLTVATADVLTATRRLGRVVKIQKLLVEQIHIPATMLPLDFLRFRGETKVVDGVTNVRGLSPSSGTESYQFREIEIVAGLKGDAAHAEFLQGSPRLDIRLLTPAQKRRLAQPSLPEAFKHLLERRGVKDVVEIFTAADRHNPHADLAELADVLLEFDEFFRLWRVHHATMVQTMIGEKSGTGFLGPEYLRETAGMGMQGKGRVFPTPQVRPRFFESLWAARTRLGRY
ncbi:MAG: hypothetical protein HY023_04395 [Chloroflexi bacterium]|nr:hypothetical protein [Chloroflexota bacterium]